MSGNNDFLDGLAIFTEEARELIEQMEDILLRAEAGDSSEDDLHALFRCAHTIKGSGGLFNLDEVVRFTHVVENILDELRKGVIGFSSELISILLESQDHISGMISAIASDEPSDAEERSNELIQKLKAISAKKTNEASAAESTGHSVAIETPPETVLSNSGGEIMSSDNWHISLRFKPEVLTYGMDPLTVISYLSNYGRITHLETVCDALPELLEADPERCYLGFEVALASTASKEEIASTFEFIAENAQITMLPPHSRTAEFIAMMELIPEGIARLGDILIACGTLTKAELDAALSLQVKSNGSPRLGEILIERGVVKPLVVDAAVDKQRRNEEKRTSEVKNLKVPSDRLDLLIDRVGELVIAGAGNYAQASRIKESKMLESASLMITLVERIRDMTLGLRMVPIGEVFSRFPRVVRDVSKELGKQIELTIFGADAELDKSMVEKIGDPLMHLIRNSMDHGIETIEERIAAGKPEQGTVSLNAYHESGAIIVEVSDDGKGLNPERILRKAIENGLITEEEQLSEDEIFRLILVPGFSTAEKITQLSGRGVGMDVVKSSIESMRGTIDIQSTIGQGTTIRLCLPLTLAIIDGFHVGVGESHFIVPLDTVIECVDLPIGTYTGDYIEQRDKALPLIRLSKLLKGGRQAVGLRQRVVIIRFGARRAGLVVDRIHGKCQTVIKPLGPLFKKVPCVSGSTILGDGEVALILDVAELVGNAIKVDRKQVMLQ